MFKAPVHEYPRPTNGQIVLGNGDAALDDDLLLVRQPGLAGLFHSLCQIFQLLILLALFLCYYAGRDAIASVLTHVKARPLLRTAHAMRASLLASAMASTL